MESDKHNEEKKKNPRKGANLFSLLTYSWTIPIFFKCLKNELEVEDLPEPLKEHSSSNIGDKLEREWDKEVEKAALGKKQPSLNIAIFEVFGLRLMLYGILMFVCQVGVLTVQPLLLGGLISYFTPGNNLTKNEAFMYAFGVILCSLASMLLDHPYFMCFLHLGMKLRIAMCSLLYRKALGMTKATSVKTTGGQVVNLMTNDVGKFDIGFALIHVFWVGPIQTIIITYLMWRLVGPASVIGVMALLVLLPLQGWLGKRISAIRLNIAQRTDNRIHLMNEIINGIQAIKMYTWEIPFANVVSSARSAEINQIKKSSYIKGILMSFGNFQSRMSIFITVLSYVLLGNSITAEKVFVVSAFYSTLGLSMTVYLPLAAQQVAEGFVSIERCRQFLILHIEKNTEDETNQNQIENNEKNKYLNLPCYIHDTENDKSCKVSVLDAHAKWTSESAENTLKSISLDCVPGQLTVIIGSIGSGKTSFLQTLLGELKLNSGCIKIDGKMTYASQEPWLFQGNIRQNILFGKQYNKERYRRVVNVCALRHDLELLPYGDKTIVGERGISLSGGQKARVNLARAVYHNSDIYLLDDPLSAVDTHVGSHLFENCIKGFLKEKIVILITHQLQYLEMADQIVAFENGSISGKGTYHELKISGYDFSKLVKKNEENVTEENNEDFDIFSKNWRNSRTRSSIHSAISSIHDDVKEPDEIYEIQTKGHIGSNIYIEYLKAAGGLYSMFFVIFVCVITQVIASGGDIWLTHWVNLEEEFISKNDTTIEIDQSRNLLIYILSGLTLGTIATSILRSYLLFGSCMEASKTLHRNMFHSISRTTMRFFNNNPSGGINETVSQESFKAAHLCTDRNNIIIRTSRTIMVFLTRYISCRILNRFSKDMGIIDELMPSAIMDVVEIFLIYFSILIVVTIVNPWLLIPSAVCTFFIFLLRILFLATSRKVKRLEGICRSPVFSHLNASLQGLPTIRAFNAQKLLIDEFDNHQDLHSSSWYLFIAISRAFALWLDMVCLLYIALVTLSFLIISENAFGGNVGLAITQSIGLTGMFQWGIRQSAELENQMTSVERVLEYSNLESEPPLESDPDKKPKESWPENGLVEFNNVNLRYSPDEPWVLKNLCFSVHPGEKLGIVGRTGAGKSSMIAALFRLTQVEGQIIIDGVESASLGLHDLRSKISIIPQEPILFSGTLRKNLDPFDNYLDEVLWRALDDVKLQDMVKDINNGLMGEVTEGGSNLSVGQRQLICLARAIIQNNNILVLDEATSNVDPKTDLLIQETIRKKFSNCTVLTIAHRLNTIMDCDKVLFLEDGSIMEFNHPFILLQNTKGKFFEMVEQTGKRTRDILHDVAAKSYNVQESTRL